MTIKGGPYAYDWKEGILAIALIVLFSIFQFSTALLITIFLSGGWLYWRLRQWHIITVTITDKQLLLQYANWMKMDKTVTYPLDSLNFVVRKMLVQRGMVRQKMLSIYSGNQEIAAFMYTKTRFDWDSIQQLIDNLKKARVPGISEL
ncbi:hypothetical protein [Chitinophaga dinghuensis]|nr:hypothetical protein [Chitinophaga dinghuensis]